jgi:hypothetical protein
MSPVASVSCALRLWCLALAQGLGVPRKKDFLAPQIPQRGLGNGQFAPSTPTKPPQLHQDEQGRVDAEMRERATAVSVYISGLCQKGTLRFNIFSERVPGRSIFIIIILFLTFYNFEQYCIFKMVGHDGIIMTSCLFYRKLKRLLH